VFFESWIRIYIRVKSWTRLLIKAKIKELQRLENEAIEGRKNSQWRRTGSNGVLQVL
jgi:hypothetical protein